ncbi:MAG: hypothetical protein NVS1B3_04390 [Candidatus Dormibacteraceae bacterium]
MVGVKGVAEAEGVGQPTQGKERRVLRGVDEQQPPTGEVENTYTAKESAQTAALPAIEGTPEKRKG